jgi:hypothetical protein
VKVTLYSALCDVMLLLSQPSQDGKQFITVSPTRKLPFHGSVTRTWCLKVGGTENYYSTSSGNETTLLRVIFRCRSQFNDTNFTLPYGGASRSVDIGFTRLIIGVCNGARIRGLARSLKLLLVIVIMAADNLIHDDLAGMQTTCDLTRKRYIQCRLGISRPVVLRGKDQMPVSPISFHRTPNRNSISRIRVQLPGEQEFASSQIWKFNGKKKKE